VKPNAFESSRKIKACSKRRKCFLWKETGEARTGNLTPLNTGKRKEVAGTRVGAGEKGGRPSIVTGEGIFSSCR